VCSFGEVRNEEKCDVIANESKHGTEYEDGEGPVGKG